MIVVGVVPLVVGALLGAFTGRSPEPWWFVLSVLLLLLVHGAVAGVAGMLEDVTLMRVLEGSGVGGWLAFAVTLLITRRRRAARPKPRSPVDVS